MTAALPFRPLYRGCGAALPDRILTNAELSTRVETSDEWIRSRTGIQERRLAGPEETTADLAERAAQKALSDAGMSADDIDLLVLATATPDLTFPSTATIVQGRLGMTKGAAFDVHAVCTGFVYALATASNFLSCGQHRRALVIGAETFSRLLDWTDRTTCVLFGDGAGAMVLEAVPTETAGDRGVLSTYLCSDGRLTDLLYVDGGPSRTGTVGHLRMQGNKVFKAAVIRIADAMAKAAERADIPLTEIDWFVPHQANERIIGGVVDRLNLDRNRVVSTIARHGNTSAASIPLAFETARRDGRLKDGDLVAIEGMGGGLTWGAGLMRL
ncbi:3-oxoacyl-(acyl carrier protein) synthase [Parvularcula bermudensis HTCC2503]|uniref:Beta-ketoacyl-[acyl-carrier-protein] synthase III n=1 Tax=Parvularcula bermudensis (strain ATCC BAA-594 / HTCC2503 / KCTC 12087) TaxID=314260 RepID=E0TBG8_PARBH|nr:beta-ketoacyl-ACP synthase III [Parvularcula bermudensis]ADM08343.1 3-oxoacyl-(acyl carrier protein) synthase [Parvularcula bermudensis HTCC2503]